MAFHGKRKVPLKVDEVEYNEGPQKRKILTLEELCKKRIQRYNHLKQFPSLHKFSIVRQIVDDIVKEVYDTILSNELSTTVSVSIQSNPDSNDERREVCLHY